MDRGAWWATARGVAESNTNEHEHTPPFLSVFIAPSLFVLFCFVFLPSLFIRSFTENSKNH